MKKVLYVYLYFCVVACASQNKSCDKINGVSFVASPQEIFKEHILPVKHIGANWAAVMPFGFIKDLQAPEVRFNLDRQWWGERLEGTERTIELLQEKGIKVMIKPQLWVWHGEFTGHIEMKTEEGWRILEKTYQNFILLYAKAAEKYKVPLFCIGTELHTFVKKRPQFWTHLIRKIKSVYTGDLTYAENWDQYQHVPFWDQIDYIGIDAYFPLSEKETPSVTELNQHWLPHKNQIKALHNTLKKPILFTEYGYRSVSYGTREPWKTDRNSDPYNHVLQENALKALYQTFWNEPWFSGGFLWKWFHNYTEAGGLQDNRFTVQNKPAEKIVSTQYKQSVCK
ncbi:glycoside hydrolase [Aquimarina sp. ERC-38]|uniref:glycoside hydrolase family 113 n=1 Tax=Aquimarina sp. ERC-38 TaxID=2949996 RepID=UPI002247FCA4|nr:glycoside hydrolase [Aquimarina sp. ERC-38]UZO81473.1 glycoside hydrolase [Aquimarina sp. ERC-38]